jgi:hypothetical protein
VVSQAALGEECERELEREEEQEEEVERQVPRVAAADERDWEYDRAPGAASLQDLVRRCAGLKVLQLKELAAMLEPQGMRRVVWSASVFCTSNFALAIKQPAGNGALNEYLRAVDAMLVLPQGEEEGGGPSVLLLSERECNALLEVLWKGGSNSSSASYMRTRTSVLAPRQAPLLTSLCYAYKAQGIRGLTADSPLRLAVGLGSCGTLLADRLKRGELMQQLVSLALFNGETTYVDQGQAGPQPWEVLRELPQLRLLRALVKEHALAVEALVAMRGKQVLLSRSQLEQACDPDRHECLIVQVPGS